jgi:hypothetical protein
LQVNKIGPEAVKAIAESLKINRTLQHLHIGGTSLLSVVSFSHLWLCIGCSAGQAMPELAECLKVNQTLLTLDLYGIFLSNPKLE